MRINKYKTLLNANGIPEVVREEGKNYTELSNLSSPTRIAQMFRTVFDLHRETEEHAYLLCLNNKNHPIGVFEISHGTVNMSVLRPREVYMKALVIGATSIVLVHNHPSGDRTPSKEDRTSLKNMIAAGKMLGMPLLDSIILAGQDYYSFLEKERELFN